MKSLKWPALIVGFVLLMLGTVIVFVVFDRDSHSASDTIRPFVITMAPVWAVAIAGAMVLLENAKGPLGPKNQQTPVDSARADQLADHQRDG